MIQDKIQRQLEGYLKVIEELATISCSLFTYEGTSLMPTHDSPRTRKYGRLQGFMNFRLLENERRHMQGRLL
jgi:hypothetical protein